MDNLSYSLEVMIVGFTVVVISLYLLYLVLVVFSRCCVRPAKPEPQKTNSTNVPPAVMAEANSAPVAAAVSEPQQSYGTAPEIIAAITAAVSASMNMPANQFEIVSVQRPQSNCNGSEWAIAGRKRLMEKRQDLAMFRRERR